MRDSSSIIYGRNPVREALSAGTEIDRIFVLDRNEEGTLGRIVSLARKKGIRVDTIARQFGSRYTKESLERSILFCQELDISHISAYMLKIEPGTPYSRQKNSLSLPDEDTVCDLYEYTVQRLKKSGFAQYEISNFSKPGLESRHNLKYWNCEEYLGLGPGAHSFINKNRFYYERNFDSFFADITVNDGKGGSEDEYITMRLRLSDGISKTEFKRYFGYDIPQKYIDKAAKLEKLGYTVCTQNGFSLSVKGFLISNTIITEILTAK